MKKTFILSVLIGVIGLSTLATPVFAQVGNTRLTASQRIAQRIQNGQHRGGVQVQNRINALNKILARIQSMKNLSASQKSSITVTIQASITSLNTLETAIQADSSTTTLQADLKTIAPQYRIYMLVVPQMWILSAVDRINTLVNSFQIIQNKITSRVSADASLSANATITSDLSTISTNISNAATEASSAQAEVIGLTPDQGNQTVAQSNTAALKDAHLKIKTATTDLVSARNAVRSIIQLIIPSDRSLGTASTTAQ